MIISSPVQSEASLEHATQLLDSFDGCKDEFRSIGCSVNLLKVHSLQYYNQQIREYGTPDNYDTEYTEHQHILDAKEPYRASNRCEATPQMLGHVQC